MKYLQAQREVARDDYSMAATNLDEIEATTGTLCETEALTMRPRHLYDQEYTDQI